METTNQVIDVTDEVKTEIISSSVFLAQQKGENVLALKKCDRHKLWSGPFVSYCLEYRWLSNPASVHCVQGNDFTYWEAKYIKKILRDMEKDNTKTLFDFFDING